MAKTSLRRVIDAAIERAYVAGAEWGLIQSGVDSAKANRQINAWHKQRKSPTIPMLQENAREQISRSIMEATFEVTGGKKRD